MRGGTPLLLILLGLLAVTFFALLLFADNGVILGMSADSFAHLGALTALLVLFSAGMFRRGERISSGVTSALIWIAIGLALMVGYTYYNG